MRKVLMSCAVLAIGIVNGYSQNIDEADFMINSAPIPPSIKVGDTAKVAIIITNNGARELRAGSVMASITAPGIGQFVGIAPESASQWVIQDLSDESTANQLVLVNANGALGIAPFDESFETTIYAYLVGKAVGNNAFNANVNFNFYNGPDSFANYQMQGNANSANDNNTTSLTVNANPGTVNPLHFIGINAAWKGSDGIVKWTVAQELNNKYFSVERSFDGKNFKEAGQVTSIGDHQDQHVYTFVDANVKAQASDKVYYRVKQIDIDGASTSTSIVSLSIGESAAEAYVFPNPVRNDNFSFVYENANIKDAVLEIQILDAHGRMLVNATKNITKGKNQIQLSTSGMTTGIYYLNYVNAENNIKGTLRLVKN